MKYLIILFVSIICIGVGVKFVSSNYKTKLLIDNEKKIKYYFWGMVLSICGVVSYFLYFVFMFYKQTQTAKLFDDYVAFSNAINENINLFSGFAPLFAIFMISAVVFAFCQKRYRILKSGLKGERATQKTLLKLPADYTILSNVSIKYEDKVAEIDNLILSPKGIVIVETKSYKGTLRGKEEDSEWSFTKTSNQGKEYTSSIKNPLKQAKRQTYILSQILKENNINCWIDGYLFLHNAKSYIDSDSILLNETSLTHKITSSGKDNALRVEDIQRIKEILKINN